MLLLNPSLTASKIQKSMGMCIREQYAENSFFPRHATLADLRLRKRGPTFLFWKVGLAPRPGEPERAVTEPPRHTSQRQSRQQCLSVIPFPSAENNTQLLYSCHWATRTEPRKTDLLRKLRDGIMKAKQRA